MGGVLKPVIKVSQTQEIYKNKKGVRRSSHD